MLTYHALRHALFIEGPSVSLLIDAPATITEDLPLDPQVCLISHRASAATEGLYKLPHHLIVLSEASADLPLAPDLTIPVSYHHPGAFLLNFQDHSCAYLTPDAPSLTADLIFRPGLDFATLTFQGQSVSLPTGSSFTFPPLRVLEVAIPEITPQSVKAMSDRQLLDAHRVLHRAWANLMAGHHYNREYLVNAHLAVYQEMLRRGMNHSIVSDIDLETLRLLRSSESSQPFFPEPLDEFVWIDDFISLSGSAINFRQARDLDLIIRGDLDVSDPRKPYLHLPFVPLRIKLERLFHPDHRPMLHYVDEPTGPNWSYQPLFRLVLQPVDPTIRHIPDRFSFYGSTPEAGRSQEAVKPMQPFTPMKAQAAYHVGEFFDTDELYRLWAKPFFDADRPIAVQEKFDGIRMIMHKQGDKVAIYTEDKKRDRASVLPHIVQAIQALPADSLILDTEFVIWEGGKPIPRHQMVGLVTAKEPYTKDTDIRVNVHDCLYLNGQDLTTQPYEDRLDALKKVLPRAKPPLYPAPTRIATSKTSLDQAIAWASKQPGSEGAMLKTVDSPYETTGATPASHLWAKFKLVKEIKVQVIGIYTKPLPWASANLSAPKQPLTGAEALQAFRRLTKDSNTFIYRCAYLDDDKLTPLRAKGTVAPADLELRWVVKGQKDPLTGQVASSSQWRGPSDPDTWTMAKGFPQDTQGAVPYATTYASSVATKLGDIITVQPVRLDSFIGADGQTYFSWTFPRVTGTDPERDKPDTLDDVRRLARASEAQQLDPETIEDLPQRERQRIQLEEDIGDWYLLEQPKDGPRAFTVQYHLRGIWHSDALADLRQAIRAANSKSALARIWRDYHLAVVTDLDALKAAAQKADDEKTDVSAAIAKFLDTDPPDPDDLPSLWPKLVNQGNVHIDWRFQMPKNDALFGWTLDTPKSVLQFLADGHFLFPLRDRFLDNQEQDNILCQKKAMQPLAWFSLVSKSKPIYEAQPATVGATPETAGIFLFKASGKFLLLCQKSDYHEYAVKFDDHPKLNGRWGFQLIPPRQQYEKAPKWPWWMLNKPHKTQAPYILTHSRKAEETKARKEKVDIIWNPHAITMLKSFLPQLLDGFTDAQITEKVDEFSA